jgi:hypothetical protein
MSSRQGSAYRYSDRVAVTQAQIDRVRQTGVIAVEAIAAATDRVSGRFYLSVTMIDKESRGVNRYGRDEGGVLAGFTRPVNMENYLAFRHEVMINGRISNGVGPAQITHPDLLKEMEGEGLKPWEAYENIFFGVRRLTNFYRHARDVLDKAVWDAVWYAGKKYNGRDSYADEFVALAKVWRERLGNADYA